MRPHTLTMTAFTSFQATQVIDFRAFHAASLLLIHGVTGAGKSSILDAICFALYGEPADPDRKASDLRCNRAAAELLTSVALEFALGDKDYRITREPEQAREKKRGTGTTRHPASATLWELHADGTAPTVITAGASKTTERVIAMLGFQAAQFRQVIVLPQGRFRELLISRSDEREKILRSLFHTHVYNTLAELLRSKKNAAVAEFRGKRQELAGMLSGHGVESVEALSAELETLERDAKQLETAIAGSAQDHELARVALDGALAHNARVGQRAALRFQLAERDAEEPRAALLAEQIDYLTRVARTVTAYRLRAHAQAELRLAEQEQHDRELGEVKANDALILAQEDLRRCKANDSQQVNFARRIDQLKEATATRLRREEAFAGQVTLQTRLERHLQRREQLLIEIQAQELRLSQAREAQASREQLVESQTQLKVEQQALCAQLVSLRALQRAVQTSERTQRALRTAQAPHDLHVAQLRDLLRDHEALLSRFHGSRASALARTLADGAPCPVCGSADHPSPARRTDDDADESSVKASAERVNKARSELECSTKARDAAALEASEARGVVAALTTGPSAAALPPAGDAEAVGLSDPVALGPRSSLEPLGEDIESIGSGLATLTATLSTLDLRLATLGEEITAVTIRAASLPSEERKLALLRGTPAYLDANAGPGGAASSRGLERGDARGEDQAPTSLADLDLAIAALLGVIKDRQLALEVEEQGLQGEIRELIGTSASALTQQLEQVARQLGELQGLLLRATKVEQEATQAWALASARARDALALVRERYAALLLGHSELVSQLEAQGLDASIQRSGSGPLTRNADLPDAQEAQVTALTVGDERYQTALRQLDEPSALTALQQEIKAHQDVVLALRSKLDTFADLPSDAQRIDEASLRAQFEQCAASLKMLRERQGGVAGRVQTLTQLASRLEEQRLVLAQQEAELKTLASVADAALGDTESRISFERYVLAELLDEVVQSASVRLLEMSMQRLELVRVDEGERSNSPKGLDIHVLDAHVGKARPPHTLSGGESFLAALALSLALTDVVLRHSGGRRLDALFIDEGFGTLDPESLDRALDVLVKLPDLTSAASSRRVVIISHVQELQTRIGARIEVLREAGGSRVRLHGTSLPGPA